MSPESLAPRTAAACLIGALLALSAPQARAQDWRPFDDTAVQRYEPPRARRPRPPAEPPAEAARGASPDTAPLPAYGAPPPWGAPAAGNAPPPFADDRSTDTVRPAQGPRQGPSPYPSPASPQDAFRGPANAAAPSRFGDARPDAGGPRPSPSYAPVELSPIERADLAPVMAGDGSGLPHEFWRGLDLAALEKHLAVLPLPPRSAALAGLWRKLLLADVAAPAGGRGGPFLAVRLEALHRSGLVADEDKLLAGASADAAAAPVVTALKARAAIGAGRAEEGCAAARALSARIDGIPEGLRGEILLFAGYCAAVAGNPAAAGLAAELAREAGIQGSLGLQVLDAIAAGAKPRIELPKSVSVTEFRLLEVARLAEPAAIVPHAQPALLEVLARDQRLDPRVRIPAAEAAARAHAIDPATLAAVYRTVPFEGGDPTRADPALRRAAIFKAIEADRNPNNRTRGMRAMFDDARRNGLLLPAMMLAAPLVADLQKVPEIGWFAETAVETLIAAGNYEAARQWVRFSETLDGYGRLPAGRRGAGLDHWLALADIADDRLAGPRGTALPAVEQMAVRGRLAPDFLHRLATVLDALDYHVPIPLWEIASRTPQPSSGFLPETGVLTELQDAAKRKEFGRTVMLAMRALGPNSAEGAHMIALGDAIRALRRAGLGQDARRLAMEALFAGWPRNLEQ